MKRKLKWYWIHRRNGGPISDGIILYLIGLTLYNLIDQIEKNQNIIERWPYTLPFIILALIVFIFKNKTLNMISFYIVGLFSLVFSPNHSSFNAALLFLYSFHQNRTYLYAKIIILTTFVGLLLRMIILDETISKGFLMIFTFSFFYYQYIHIFHPFKNNILNKLTREHRVIVELTAQGNPQKTVGANMGMTRQQVNDELKKIRKNTGSNSLTNLMYKYGQSQ